MLEILEPQIQRAAKKAMSTELEPSGTLTVEHILPKSTSAAWRTILEKDQNLADDVLIDLGTCLLTGINRDLAGKSFEEKRKMFAKSGIELTRQVSGYSSWDRNSIEQRQQLMAKHAVSA